VVDLSILFEQFKREKQFLAGGAAATLRSYSKSWLVFVGYHGCACPPLTAARLKSWVIVMASEGLKPGAINSYARSINSFPPWLYDKSL
jgi:hypothetical protein